MSLAVEVHRSTAERSKCPRLFWTIFPHFCLILSLVLYGGFGALLFCHIEGKSNATRNGYDAFLQKLVNTVQNHSANSSHENLMNEIDRKITTEFKSIWLQRPERWTFFGSLFFCCTVFTTVGYGEIYPVTLPGKVFCMAYAMVGIPLMLLVITDVGNILAAVLSSAYRRVHRVCQCALCSGSFWRCEEKPADEGPVHDGTYVFTKDVLVQQPEDKRQASVRNTSALLHNAEIFSHMVTQENLAHGTLQRSLSCPSLSPAPPIQSTRPREVSEIRDELEELDVPMTIILVVVFTYILLIGLILPLWETEIKPFDAIYFCFITLTTIGFGDIVPQHPKFFMLTSLFIISGMAIMSMAFKLGQSRIVSAYHTCMHCISGGMSQKNKLRESA